MVIDKYLGTDFAALRTLHLVHELRSFTKTAQRLNVNQSAISYTIDKLRTTFSDPLFIRQSGTVVATVRCDEIVQSTQRILLEFESLLEADEFDPAFANSKYNISSNYYERQVLMPSVISHVRKAAPNISIDLLAATTIGVGQIKSGEADLLLGPFKPDENDLYCKTLFTEKYVCVMDPKNELANSKLSMEAYVNANHIVIDYGGAWRSPYVVQIEKMGIELNKVLSVPSPAGVHNMVRRTDLIATVPQRVALEFGKGVKICQMPIDVKFELNMVWSTRTHKSSLHRWMRSVVASCNK